MPTLDRAPIVAASRRIVTRSLDWWKEQANAQASYMRDLSEAFGRWPTEDDRGEKALPTQPGGDYRTIYAAEAMDRAETERQLAEIEERRALRAVRVSDEDAALVAKASAYIHRPERAIQDRTVSATNRTPGASTVEPRPFSRIPVGMLEWYDDGSGFDDLLSRAYYRVEALSAAIDKSVAEANALVAEANGLADFAKGRYIPSAWGDVREMWAEVRRLWGEVRTLCERRRNGWDFIRARIKVVKNETRQAGFGPTIYYRSEIWQEFSPEYLQLPMSETERDNLAEQLNRLNYDERLMAELTADYPELFEEATV